MMNQPFSIAGKLPIKTLVAKQLPTNIHTYTHIHTHTHTHVFTHTIVKRITELYADAAKHYPKNQEILTHLFMAYVRVGDYQRQQQTAAALHKTFPESGPYYCWRVMSVLMQVCTTVEEAFIVLSQNPSCVYMCLSPRLQEHHF